MIYELTEIQINAGQQAEFEAAIQKGAASIIAHAKGFLDYQIRQNLASPEKYQLQIAWETLDDHMVGFRQSDAFVAWRAIISPFFAAAPTTAHVRVVAAHT